ncbi:helix-turn-helix domain-containing protein [Nocardia sp. NPDC056000]|uniref:helix-turn-helix domain-containing protein n=1 Tax=Nocardia sp. NPDC056000 TaxID=3345674 RepID=UPI0035DAE7CD
MNQANANWNTDAVRAAAQSGNYGVVIRAVRRASNLTLADLSRRTNYSVASLSRLETGKQNLFDVRVLRGLSEVLAIPPQLLGLADTSSQAVRTSWPAAIVGVISTPEEETDMRRRTLLTGLVGTAAALGAASPLTLRTDPLRQLEAVLLSPPSGSRPVGVDQLARELAAARTAFDFGHYSDLAARLPNLLPTAIATRDETTRARADVAAANILLTQTYLLASRLMIKFGRDQLAWTTADRAVHTAQSSDDICTVADAQRAWAIVLRRTGHTSVAQHLVVDTAATLQRELGSGPAYLVTYASLLSTAAYTAASDGDRDTAFSLLAEAADATSRLDDNNPAAVALYRVSSARVLGDVGVAIETARRINPAAIVSAERRARYWADVARAFHQWGKPEQSYRALLAAERIAPDEVRYRKPIQKITLSLLRQPGATTLPGLHAFAQRTGVDQNNLKPDGTSRS